MAHPADITGQRYGRLTALSRESVDEQRRSRWLCRCDCGATKVVGITQLRTGDVVSCGCWRSERIAAANRANATHGASRARWYVIWHQMIERCTNPKNIGFHRYAGRGINVCKRWRDPLAFHADMGDPPPGMTLERKDNDGPYSPANCRWATRKEQALNSRSAILITHDGVTDSVRGWAQRTGMPYTALKQRVRAGWDPIAAITRPIQPGKPRPTA